MSKDDSVTGADDASKSKDQLLAEVGRLRQIVAAVVDSSDDAIIGTTIDGTITTWNPGAQRLLGYSADEVIGRSASMLFPAEVQDEPSRIHERLRASGGIDHCDAVRIAKDGKRLQLCVTISPLRDGGGRVTGVTETGRDTTQLREALKSAESANAARDHFLDMLSHELRTPLTPALASVSHIQATSDLPDQLRCDMEVIRRNVETEARLVDDLIDLTVIRQGHVRLHFEIVDAHAVLGAALHAVRGEMDLKGLVVSVELRASRHHVWADPARLQQVFANLLSNAVKFTPAGGNVALRSSNDDAGRLRIHVMDSGIGIEPRAMERLFDAFEQGERATTRRYGGLGLGLSLAKSLVEMQKGTLSAASGGCGKGATFTVELNTVPGQRRPVPTTDPGIHDTRCHVLLVEDHADTRHVITRLLKTFGCTVTAAACVKEAMDSADKEQFDLLVSDIGLPDGSGTEIMKFLKSRYPIKGIAISGLGRDEDLGRSMEAGFEMHLTKPIDFSTLQKVISDVAS